MNAYENALRRTINNSKRIKSIGEIKQMLAYMYHKDIKQVSEDLFNLALNKLSHV